MRPINELKGEVIEKQKALALLAINGFDEADAPDEQQEVRHMRAQLLLHAG